MMQQPAVAVPYADVVEVASAIQGAPRVTCAGDSIVAIELQRYPPATESAAARALEATSEAVGVRHAPSSPNLLLAYLRLKPGGPCTEQERRESERLLRAQPYLASASVTAHRIAPGEVLIRVVVVDEWPYLAGASVRGGWFSAVRLGAQNLGGRGLTAVTAFENGGAYRTGYGLRLEQYGVLGRPAVATLVAERRPLGGLIDLEVAQPFLTDAQRWAVHGGLAEETRFIPMVRDRGVDAAAEVARRSYDVSWVARVGSPRRNGLVGLAGVALLREEMRAADGTVVISDSGLVPTFDDEFTGRFPDYIAGRTGLILGVRMLDYLTVSRFASLRAQQDVGRGMQASILVAPSVTTTLDRSDMLLSGDIYAGFGRSRSFVSMRAGGEARTDRLNGQWRGVAVSARVDWYSLPGPIRTRVVTLSGAALSRPITPGQLTFRDPDGGIAGLIGSHDAGGRRLVLRHEERVLMPWFRSRADLAWAAFADAGRVWKSDTPYGRTSPFRGSVGVALLAAPRFGKRTYRLDIAVPVNPGPGDAGIAFRLGSADRTGTAWMESRDVIRSRGGTGPATLTRW
jgi:hypothetical protein